MYCITFFILQILKTEEITMKDIVFGMVVGSMLGILLYKNNTCAKELFDSSEKIIMKEVNKMEESMSPKKNKNQEK